MACIPAGVQSVGPLSAQCNCTFSKNYDAELAQSCDADGSEPFPIAAHSAASPALADVEMLTTFTTSHGQLDKSTGGCSCSLHALAEVSHIDSHFDNTAHVSSAVLSVDVTINGNLPSALLLTVLSLRDMLSLHRWPSGSA